MPDIPDVINYGKVTLHAVSFQGDSSDDGDAPDEVPLSGNVLLTPLVSVSVWPTADPPRMASVTPLNCPLIAGNLYPPGSTLAALPPLPGSHGSRH